MAERLSKQPRGGQSHRAQPTATSQDAGPEETWGLPGRTDQSGPQDGPLPPGCGVSSVPSCSELPPGREAPHLRWPS